MRWDIWFLKIGLELIRWYLLPDVWDHSRKVPAIYGCFSFGAGGNFALPWPPSALYLSRAEPELLSLTSTLWCSLAVGYLPLYLPSWFSHCLTHNVLLIAMVITGVGQQVSHVSASWTGDKIALPAISGAEVVLVPSRRKRWTATCDSCLSCW